MRNRSAAIVALALTMTTTAWSQEAIQIGGLLETSGFSPRSASLASKAPCLQSSR